MNYIFLNNNVYYNNYLVTISVQYQYSIKYNATY